MSIFTCGDKGCESCAGRRTSCGGPPGGKLMLLGAPNVGKSALFNCLVGAYSTVSNYPGTSVEVTRGKILLDGKSWEVFDTPGMYSFLPVSEEELVAREALASEKPDVVLHVVDAKNLERMLPLTFQVMDTGIPMILVLNMMDEAERLGITFDATLLSEALGGIPVLFCSAADGEGIDGIRQAVAAGPRPPIKPMRLNASDETAIDALNRILMGDYGLSRRAVSILLLQEDAAMTAKAVAFDSSSMNEVMEIIRDFSAGCPDGAALALCCERQTEASALSERVVRHDSARRPPFRERLSRIMIAPATGIPIMLAVLYFGLYHFVGGFGAGFLVDLLETDLFEGILNPWFKELCGQHIPWPALNSLLAGEYGLVTLGVRYAVAIILPIVATFFLAFAVLEDSGYLPRLALLIDRLFKKIGLSGRAVIPMVLGLGCGTMATLVTRTLPTRRERLIATILLALGIPCSAQLGLILALLGSSLAALLIWGFVLCGVFLSVGYLSSLLLPGKAAYFNMELPPLRLPKASNVIIKTWNRVKWYLVEIFPVFILASLLIWAGEMTGVFQLLLAVIETPVNWIGLPDKAAVAFLFGFFRRDYGAAGFYDMKDCGQLDDNQLLVACVTLTLFLPCVAQFVMNIKERGWLAGLGISAFILPFSFGVGFLLSQILTLLHIQL